MRSVWVIPLMFLPDRASTTSPENIQMQRSAFPSRHRSSLSLAFMAVLLLGLTAFLSGCLDTFDAEKPGAPCLTDSDCPAGTFCDPNSNRCVSSGDTLLDMTDTPGDTPDMDVVEDCGGSCVAGETCCSEMCVDLGTSSEHCGACGNSCLEGESCVAGFCACDAPEGVQSRACRPLEGETCCPGSGCVDTQESPQACGACGIACNPGESCDSSLCNCGGGLACAPGTVCCGDTCCGQGELCCQGVCMPADAIECQCGDDGACSPTELCCTTEGNEGCIAPLTDLQNCGACGNICGDNELCNGGSCECAQGFGDCDGNPDNGCETNLASSQVNCGTCGNACLEGTTCTDGTCLCPATNEACGFGEACCDSGCSDVFSDTNNCGACGNACPQNVPNATAVACASGECQPTCTSGYADCDGDPSNGCEVDTRIDGSHCGSCGNPCGPGRDCQNGMCVCTSGSCLCTQDETWCDPNCVDTDTDVDNCGSCDNACDGGKICDGGSCVCPAGQTDCNGTCRNLNTSAANCGGCGNNCNAHIFVNSATCNSGSCNYTCDPGFEDCSPSDGCETDLDTNNNCGACGNQCSGGKICSNQACVCPAGQTDCNGTCHNLNNDDNNCGNCDVVCPADKSCSSGQCLCGVGESDCNGNCVVLSNDNDNCGFCGNRCDQAGESCQNGLCLCSNGQPIGSDSNCGSCGNQCPGQSSCSGSLCVCPGGQELCSGICVDTRTDPDNCGNCGFQCQSFETCQNGVCQADYQTVEMHLNFDNYTQRARLRGTCSATGDSCLIDQPQGDVSCFFQCPTGSPVEYCCSNGSYCGGTPAAPSGSRSLVGPWVTGEVPGSLACQQGIQDADVCEAIVDTGPMRWECEISD